jgi:hypothetical protein
MRALEERIPLGPVLGNFPIRINHHERVFPTRVHAFFAAPFFIGVLRPIARSASTRQAGDRALRRVAEGNFGSRKRQAGAKHGYGRLGRALQSWFFTALRDEYAVGTFRVNSFDGTPRPVFMAWQGGQGLRPIRDRLIRSGNVFSAFKSGNRGKRAAGRSLRLHALHSTFYKQAGGKCGCGQRQQSECYFCVSHEFPLIRLQDWQRSDHLRKIYFILSFRAKRGTSPAFCYCGNRREISRLARNDSVPSFYSACRKACDMARTHVGLCMVSLIVTFVSAMFIAHVCLKIQK